MQRQLHQKFNTAINFTAKAWRLTRERTWSFHKTGQLAPRYRKEPDVSHKSHIHTWSEIRPYRERTLRKSHYHERWSRDRRWPETGASGSSEGGARRRNLRNILGGPIPWRQRNRLGEVGEAYRAVSFRALTSFWTERFVFGFLEAKREREE